MHASTPCNVNKASKVHHTAGKPLISHNFLSFLIIYRNLATHGLFFFYSYLCCSQYEQIYGLYESHISKNKTKRSLLQGCFGTLAAEALHLWSHLRCHTYGASHVPAGEAPFCATLQWSNQQSGQRPSTQPTHWIMWPAATEVMLFLKKLNPAAKVFSTPLLRALSFHDTWTYDSSRLGLSFNVCQGQSSQRTHTRQGEAALRGRVITKCKGR